MTNEELMERFIFIPATPRVDRVAPISVRRRGDNVVENDAPHPSEAYDSFFEYEDEFYGTTAARDTINVVNNDLDNSTEHVSEIQSPVNKEADELSEGFIVMEKLPTQKAKINEIAIINNDLSESEDKTSFEFIRCSFIKDDEKRCKKQAKKGETLCGIHKKFVNKKENEK